MEQVRADATQLTDKLNALVGGVQEGDTALAEWASGTKVRLEEASRALDEQQKMQQDQLKTAVLEGTHNGLQAQISMINKQHQRVKDVLSSLADQQQRVAEQQQTLEKTKSSVIAHSKVQQLALEGHLRVVAAAVQAHQTFHEQGETALNETMAKAGVVLDAGAAKQTSDFIVHQVRLEEAKEQQQNGLYDEEQIKVLGETQEELQARLGQQQSLVIAQSKAVMSLVHESSTVQLGVLKQQSETMLDQKQERGEMQKEQAEERLIFVEEQKRTLQQQKQEIVKFIDEHRARREAEEQAQKENMERLRVEEKGRREAEEKAWLLRVEAEMQQEKEFQIRHEAEEKAMLESQLKMLEEQRAAHLSMLEEQRTKREAEEQARK